MSEVKQLKLPPTKERGNEVWALIPGFQHHYVSNWGRVKTEPYFVQNRAGLRPIPPGLLEVSSWAKQRPRVAISEYNRRKTFYIADLVLQAFHGPKQKGAFHTHFLNEDAQCCWLWNLERKPSPQTLPENVAA